MDGWMDGCMDVDAKDIVFVAVCEWRVVWRRRRRLRSMTEVVGRVGRGWWA